MDQNAVKTNDVLVTPKQADAIRKSMADVIVARRILTKKALQLEALLNEVGLFDSSQPIPGDVSVLRDDESSKCDVRTT